MTWLEEQLVNLVWLEVYECLGWMSSWSTWCGWWSMSDLVGVQQQNMMAASECGRSWHKDGGLVAVSSGL